MGGGGNTRTVEYVQAPTPQAAPQRTPEELDYLAQQKTQMAEMQKAYQSSLENLNKQYQTAQAQSSSVLQQLQTSALAQQQTADRNRADLASASEASTKQLSLLAASRDQAVGQSTDLRNQQTQQTGGMYERLARRRAARRTTY